MSLCVTPSAGTVGYWCYDDEGTKGMELLIDQTKEMKTDMLVFGQVGYITYIIQFSVLREI